MKRVELTLQLGSCNVNSARHAGSGFMILTSTPHDTLTFYACFNHPVFCSCGTQRPGSGQLQFSHFLDLERRFPKMFYPVASLQVRTLYRAQPLISSGSPCVYFVLFETTIHGIGCALASSFDMIQSCSWN